MQSSAPSAPSFVLAVNSPGARWAGTALLVACLLGPVACGAEPPATGNGSHTGSGTSGTLIASSDTAVATVSNATNATATASTTAASSATGGQTSASSAGIDGGSPMGAGVGGSGNLASSDASVGGTAGTGGAGSNAAGAAGMSSSAEAGDAVTSSGGASAGTPSGTLGTAGGNASTGEVPAGSLMFTEYVEGVAGGDKAIELSNLASGSLPLDGCQLEVYFNGNVEAGRTLPLTGELGASQSYVVCHNNASESLANACDLMHSGLSFNGNDSLVLRCAGAVVDSFGQVGGMPDKEYWEAPGGDTTKDVVLRRRCMAEPKLDPLSPFDLAASWVAVGESNDALDFDGIGEAACTG